MGHFGWTDAFHKQHYSRVIWSTLWYWIRKQINIWRERGGLRGHQKSIHQSNHTVNNAYRKLKGRLLMIKQEKTILLLNNYFSMFVWLHEIEWHLLYLIEWQSIFFLSRMNDMPLLRKKLQEQYSAEEALKRTYKVKFKQKLKEIREWGLFAEREGRAANPQHSQILRVDREGMIDDVICAKKTLWIQSSRIFAVIQNARKRCCWHCNIWAITLLLISKLHTGVCEETFNVNIKIIIIQTTQNIWNFIVGKSSLQEMASFRRLSGRFHTLI